MDRIRSWPVFLGMWATQATAIAAVEAIYIQGPLFAPVVGAGAVLSAIGLFFGWRRAAGRFESPALISFLVGIPAALWVLLMLVTARLPWMLLYLLVATQFARNPWVRERRDFYVGCGITVVWIIFAAGHVLAGWPIAKFFVLYVAAMLFALIASHVDERFFTAEGGGSDELLRRGVVPLTALAMSVAVVSIGALIYLFALHPASLRLGMVDASGGVTPRLGDEGIALPPGEARRGSTPPRSKHGCPKSCASSSARALRRGSRARSGWSTRRRFGSPRSRVRRCRGYRRVGSRSSSPRRP